jgi:hypothetical protein
MIDNADVGVASAALHNSVQSPISNLFHAHRKIPSFFILNDLECGQMCCSVGFEALAFGSWLLAFLSVSSCPLWLKFFISVHPRKSAVEWLRLNAMSRKPAPIKIINLEDGMPQVEEARLRMQRELQIAQQQGYTAVKLIHGYGSTGVGGSLRIELQKELQRMAGAGALRSFVTGEDWRISNEKTWELLKRYPEWKRDSDLGKANKGISIVLL